MKKFRFLALVASVVSSPVFAADMSVSVSNLTRGLYFTPLLVGAHQADSNLFTSGTAASSSLQMMAEGGNTSDLATDLTAINTTIIENPASGLLGPGASTISNINTDAATNNTQLNVVAMMLPANDGFIGLNGITLPTTAGT
jgi:hypothetical protein